MRPAEKRDDVVEPIAPDGSAADRDAAESGAAAKHADGPGTAPAASLTAALIRRSAAAEPVEHVDTPAAPATHADARAQQAVLEEAFAEPAPLVETFDEPEPGAASSDAVDSPVAAESPVVADPPDATEARDAAPTPVDHAAPVTAAAPVERATPIEREAFQSVRESAAEWNLFRAPSAGFWDRLMKDVAIFTIFFAVLVFVILQIM